MSYNHDGYGYNPASGGNQAPPPVPPRPPQEYYDAQRRQTATASQAYGGYTGQDYGAASPNLQSQQWAQQYSPPYPTDNYGGHQQYTQHQRSPSSPTMNPSGYYPQHFTQPTSFNVPTSRYSTQPSQGQQPQRTNTYSPQTYNPASYQDSSIANAVSQTFGPVSGGSGYSPAAYSAASPGMPGQQQFTTSPTSPHAPRQVFSSTQANFYNRTANQYAQTYPYPSTTPLQQSTAGYSQQMNQQTNQQYSTYSSYSNLPTTAPPQQQQQQQQQYTQDFRTSPTPGQTSPYRPASGPPPSESPFSITPEPPANAGYQQPASHQSLGRSDTSGRHPGARPLPGPPQDGYSEPNFNVNQTHYRAGSGYGGHDELFREVEAAYGGITGGPSPSRDSYADPARYLQPDDPHRVPSPYFGSESPDPSNGATNGQRHESIASNAPTLEYTAGSDDSDLEAERGLAELRADEERENMLVDRAHNLAVAGGLGINGVSQPQSQSHSRSPAPRPTNDDSDDDYAGIDMTSLVPPSMSPFTLETVAPRNDSLGPQLSTHLSTSSRGSTGLSIDNQPFPSRSTSISHNSQGSQNYGVSSYRPPLSYEAYEARRRSFDENDDRDFLKHAADSGASLGEGPLDMPFQLSASAGRPLPNVPSTDLLLPSDAGIGMVSSNASQSSFAQRSTSLGGHSAAHHTPHLVPFARAKTDAEERKRHSAKSYGNEHYEPNLDLPTIPAGGRQLSKLSPRDFERCKEPWALSQLAGWLRSTAEYESELKQGDIVAALTKLFDYKVPNLGIAETENITAHCLTEMLRAGVLVHEEEWLKFGDGQLTGVIYQLTGKGCYSRSSHGDDSPGRCYARTCQRTVRKLAIGDQQAKQSESWAAFYNLKKEDIDNVDKKEVERQNILHEIVTTEESFKEQMALLRTLYRDGLKNAKPPIISPKKLDRFIDDVFGKLVPVEKANEEYLIPQLKYRQQEQGPWIVGFSDIFRDWIRKARQAYLDYAGAYPNAEFRMKQEEKRNTMFKQFLEGGRSNAKSSRLTWETFLQAPIKRLQRYDLLLTTVAKRTKDDSPELPKLQQALTEVRHLTQECDSRVAEMQDKVRLSDLGNRLILRPEMSSVDLNLNHLGRKLYHQGDLHRTGTTRFTWLDVHAILLDNYLILSKRVVNKDPNSSRDEKYDVSKMPISMDLLYLESYDDPPVVRSRVTKDIAPVAMGPKAGAPPPRDQRTNSTASGVPGPGTLTHVQTSQSMASTDSASSSMAAPPTSLDQGASEKLLFPFRIKHLGKEQYTLFAQSAQDRRTWADKIIEAKTKYAASLFAHNAEPFAIRVVADSAFAYETSAAFGVRGIAIRGTPLSRAIADVDDMYANTGRPVPICRARVNCATSFASATSQEMLAVGTDYGVYFAETGNPRGWARAIATPKVSHLAVLEEFNLFLVISDRSLVAYQLDQVCAQAAAGAGAGDQHNSKLKPPQKLSGSRDVSFFATGRMKERTLVFYKKGGRGGLQASVFKILEPVFQKSTERRSRLLGRGPTESFREYDEFYIPTDCTGIDLFTNTIAVASAKGFEVLNLERKQTWSVPDLSFLANGDAASAGSAPPPPSSSSRDSAGAGSSSSSSAAAVPPGHSARSESAGSTAQLIAQRLATSGQPVAMFRLSDAEFLCCYEECAVFVTKHGDVSRTIVIDYLGKAKAAALIGGVGGAGPGPPGHAANPAGSVFLIIFDPDFVEVRDVWTGRLKQVIPGKDVRCLDDGRGGVPPVHGQQGGSAPANGLASPALAATARKRSVKFALQHPEYERSQLVCELMLHESAAAAVAGAGGRF